MIGDEMAFYARFVDLDGETVWQGVVPGVRGTFKLPTPLDRSAFIASDKAAADVSVGYREFELAELTYRERQP